MAQDKTIECNKQFLQDENIKAKVSKKAFEDREQIKRLNKENKTIITLCDRAVTWNLGWYYRWI